MKNRIFLLLFSILALTSCSNFEEDANFIFEEQSSTFDNELERILNIADNAAERFLSNGSRSTKRKVDKSLIKTILSKESRGENDTLIYVVNFSDNDGFVIISAKDFQEPVLAVIPEGNYDPCEETDNPGFNLFMESAKTQAARIGKLDPIWGNEPDAPYFDPTANKYVKQVTISRDNRKCAPKLGLDFKWNQFGISGGENVYGALCPNHTAGCVPLAIASVVTYMYAKNNVKTTVNYTFNERQRDSELVDWAEVFKHKSSMEYYNNTMHWDVCTTSPFTHNTIAHVIRQIGKDANAVYRADSTTGASPGKIRPTLRKYLPDYQIYDRQDFMEETPSELVEDGILILFASTTKYDLGHAWICDGLNYSKTVYERYESEPPVNGKYNWVMVGTQSVTSSLAYMHWGWGGQYDGWFRGTVFDPEKEGDAFAKVKYIFTKEQ